MSERIERLIELLDVEQLETNYFRGYNVPGPWTRIFGGQVCGQALMAAGRTIEAGDRRVHSLQSYFLLAGDPSLPVMFEVDRIRDGRSFTTRRVRAFQKGEAIFALSASFHIDEEGPEHQVPAPDAPDPEEGGLGHGPFGDPREWGFPFDVRWIEPDPERGGQAVWLCTDGQVPDEPLIHAGLLAFVSDFGLVSAVAQPHAGGEAPWTKYMMASLDHMMWFHRDFRVDEWLLYSRHSPVACGSRGLALGAIHTRGGKLVCSVAQEGLIRPLKPR